MKKQENTTFHKEWGRADQMVKTALDGICGRIEASDELKRRIDRQVENGRGIDMEKNRKIFSVKKVVIGTAAACLLVGTVCIAGSGLKIYHTGGSNIPNYTKFADLEKAEVEAGYEVDVVEKFENGFAAEGIHLQDMSIENEAGQTEGSETEISIPYYKGKEMIFFSARKILEVETAEQLMNDRTADKQLQVGDIQVIFTQITNKFVPADYELTEEDKKNMEREDFNLAYGSSEVEINQGYHVKWIKNDIIYSFYGADLSLSPDEMLHMAEEVIENGQ